MIVDQNIIPNIITMIISNVKSAFRSVLMATLAATFLFACQEDETLTTADEASTDQLITDEAIADDIFEDMDEISMEAASYTTNGRMENDGKLSSVSCVTRSVERNQDMSNTVTLTFEGECEGPKGRIRTGTLVIDRSLDLENSTFTVSTTFQDFYVNGRKIEGTRTLVYAKDDSQLVTVNITLIGGKVTLEDGSVITREGNFTRTIDRESGEISMSGSATGVNRFGISYTAEITTPMVFKKACAGESFFMPAQGTKVVSREGKPDVQIDFGDGSCDKSVTLTAEGERRTIELNITRK